LYLYTDGFTEGLLKHKQGQAIRKTLGLKGFLRWLVQSKSLPIAQQLSWIKEQCNTSLEVQSDDLTMMILSGDE
ncbi:MAG: hypothetical protein GY729_02720, partial [Desulfobacteraceae bacterium]|nr:hypothetical protein [Desulfobacteraceae bacterium]